MAAIQFLFDWDWPAAEANLRDAVMLDANSAQSVTPCPNNCVMRKRVPPPLAPVRSSHETRWPGRWRRRARSQGATSTPPSGTRGRRSSHAVAVRDVHLIYLLVDAKWDPVRQDGRFRDLLGRSGLIR
jgi:hypothetical protein